MSEEMIPLKLCVDLLMQNIHAAVFDGGSTEYWVVVNGPGPHVTSTLEDLRIKVEQAVREMAKGGSDATE